MQRPGTTANLSPAQATCRACGGPLGDFRQRAEGFCLSRACRAEAGRDAASTAAREAAAAAADRSRFAAVVGETVGPLLTDVPNPLLPIVVPSNDARVCALPQGRLAAFEEQLQLNAVAAADRLDRGELPDIAQVGNDGPNPVIGNACATCRGACCFQGRTDAFLRPGFLMRRLAENPELSAESVVADYLSRVPLQTFEGSCVYHGEAGCVLPREIRSDTCNEFLCNGVLDGLEQGETPSQRVSVAVAHGRALRTGTLTTDGQRKEYALPSE